MAASTKPSIPIPPINSFSDARNGLSQAIQSVINWVLSLPPQTNMQGSRVTNVANPVNPQDAVTLAYLSKATGTPVTGTGAVPNPTVGTGAIAWKVAVSPWATITSTNGQLSLTAGGVNQNVVLSPSGAGGVLVTGKAESTNTAAMLQVDGMIRVTDYTTPTTGTGMDIFYVPSGSYGQIRAINYNTPAWEELNVDGNPLTLNGASQGSVGVGYSPNAAYKLDVNGNINIGSATSTAAYYCHGSAGQTTTVVYAKSNVGTTVTYGTMTFVGGILVAHT